MQKHTTSTHSSNIQPNVQTIIDGQGGSGQEREWIALYCGSLY